MPSIFGVSYGIYGTMDDGELMIQHSPNACIASSHSQDGAIFAVKYICMCIH